MRFLYLILAIVSIDLVKAQRCEIFLDNLLPVVYFPIKIIVNSVIADNNQGEIVQAIVLSSESNQNVNLGNSGERSAIKLSDKFGKATFEAYFLSAGRNNLFVNCGHSNASMSVLVALPSFNIDLITIVIVT